MPNRLERYRRAVDLAQVILTGDPSLDDFQIEQAMRDVRDEVEAGRKNQAEFGLIRSRMDKLLRRAGLSAVPDSGDAEFEPYIPPAGDRHLRAVKDRQ